jgi:hypothetical protein
MNGLEETWKKIQLIELYKLSLMDTRLIAHKSQPPKFT